MSEKEKIILKTNSLPGVDMSVNNLEFFTSVRIRWTKVSHTLTKKSGVTFIGTKEQLLAGDVIQVGNLGIKYKVISLKRLEARPQGYIYRIKRVDGANITSLDIDNILIGQKVHIVSNKTFQQLFEMHPDVPHIEDECEEKILDTQFCCPTRPEDSHIPRPLKCFNYIIYIPALTESELFYKDCSNSVVSSFVTLDKFPTQITVCGTSGQTDSDIYLLVGEGLTFEQTLIEC